MAASFYTQPLFLWALALTIGLPVLMLALGELNDRLARSGNPLAQGLRQIRYVVLPALAMLFIMRYILGIMGTETSIRLIETLFWLTVVYASLTLLKNLVQLGEALPGSRLAKVPPLFFALGRGVVLFAALSHVLSGIWLIDLSKLGTVLGVGSLAIALALQDSIGNVVSGFLMLATRPFQVNDWVQVGGEWMEVVEVNWRTTQLNNFTDGGLVIIPNGSLANQKIINYGQEGSLHQIMIFFTFTYDDPPNVVKEMLEEVVAGIPGAMSQPAPGILTYGYTDLGIRYRVTCIIDFWDWAPVWDGIHTRVYYAAKRYGLTMARPIEFHGNLESLKTKLAPQQIIDMLRQKPLFESLESDAIDGLAMGTVLRHYAAGETIVHQGQADEGLYAIQSGGVTLSVRDGAGHVQDIAHLQAHDFFGEMALLSNEPSPISAVALTDVNLLIIDGLMLSQLIEKNAQLAIDMNFFIEKRQAILDAIPGAKMGRGQQTAQQGLLEVVKKL